jgi:hypothetical protein
MRGSVTKKRGERESGDFWKDLYNDIVVSIDRWRRGGLTIMKASIETSRTKSRESRVLLVCIHPGRSLLHLRTWLLKWTNVRTKFLLLVM